jgi:hypothetical protein
VGFAFHDDAEIGQRTLAMRASMTTDFSHSARTWSLTLGLVGAMLGACGKEPRHLVAELKAPVTLTTERSTGFDPELAVDHGENSYFDGRRLRSSTGFVDYERIEVWGAGGWTWRLDIPGAGHVLVLGGKVVGVYYMLRSSPTLSGIGVSEALTAFSDWTLRESHPWESLACTCPEPEIYRPPSTPTVLSVATFARNDGTTADLDAHCGCNGSSAKYRLKIEFRTPDDAR